ncbi:MAG: branched-chain amino acid ABC transporter permease [Thermodesulfobacteriota bacterium]|jgi:branched-chain amino acid transport system permease protein
METKPAEGKSSLIKRQWWLALLIVVAVLAPFFTSEFYLAILGEALIMSLLALSFNLLFGYMGQLSFGQAAFYGVSGYTVAMLITKAHFNFWLSLVAGVFVASLLGLVIGFFCVRLRGIYFSILTLAFGQLIYFVIYKWHDFTGGDDGIQGVFPPEILQSPIHYYFFILVVFVFAALILWRIVNSPFGYTLKSMRENSERTEFLGINISRYQLIAFVIAAAYGGLAGVLWAPFYRSMAPSSLFWIKSGEPVMAAILGGPSLFFGPIFGMFIMTFFHAWVLGFTVFWAFIMGVLILTVIFLLPGGMLGFAEEKLKERRENRNNVADRRSQIAD